MRACRVYPLGTLREYRFVVILSRYRGQFLLSRHQARSTWETQGGHIEPGETPLEAARRELYEESGAVRFRIAAAFDYWAGDEPDGFGSGGVVFAAEIDELGALPASEMAETACFLIRARSFCAARCCLTESAIPRHSSALFSNRLFVQAGPKPRLLTV